MKRLLLVLAVLGPLAGCVAPEDRRAQLPPIEQEVGAKSYAELLRYARSYASKANDAFYENNWCEVEQAAKSLEKTATYLNEASEVPPRVKDRVKELAGDLRTEAVNLREAAMKKDTDAVNKAMQRVNLKVREMRATE